MIFYIATDADGKKHILTVETEAKKLDKNYVELDQPNDKASIKTLIQDSFDTIYDLECQIRSKEHDASIAPVTIPADEPLLKTIIDVPAGKQLPSTQTSWTATQIEDFILNHASVAQVENLFATLGNRFAEQARELLAKAGAS